MMEFDRRRFLQLLALSPLALAEAEKVQAAGFLSGLTFRGDPEEDRVLNAVADTILPKLGENDFSAGTLDLPGRFYRDPYFGIKSYLGFFIRDIQGRAFFNYTDTFYDLTYDQRLQVFEEGRNKAIGPLKNLFNGIVALTHYGALANSPEGHRAIGYRLDPSEYWKDFKYEGVSFPDSGLAVGGNLP